jgi:ATP adenylyltransferase
MKYISSEKQQDGCVFCLAVSKNDGTENLIVERYKYSFVILNRYPYTSGHLMVVPFEHQSSLEGLPSETLAEMMELSVKAIKVLRKVYNPHGFNVGVNIGEAAGAGILDHVHMHIVPRWGGDTNFISTLGKARVLPETLSDTYSRVKSKWHETDQL